MVFGSGIDDVPFVEAGTLFASSFGFLQSEIQINNR
jgi:hypothetical protein